MAESILFVDDDSMVLNALERTFLDTEYNKFFALSPAEGLEILAREKIEIVFTDIRMSPVNGYQFLKKIKEMYPSTIRIVLSAYADKQMMMKTIYDGLAKVYMLKPWDNEGILREVAHLLDMYKSLREMSLLDKISSGNNLPVLPEIYSTVMDLVKSERSMKEIAAVIEKDQVCAARILKLVNSSFYGLDIGSIHHGLVYLGIRAVQDLLLISDVFMSDEQMCATEACQHLFNHVNTCNRILHGLHQKLFARRISEEFSTAGLLHDIGRLFMICNEPHLYETIIRTFAENKGQVKLDDIEMKLVGYTHEKVGAYILDWWNLPAYIVEASYTHHHPFTGHVIPPPIMALIHAADVYAWRNVEKNNYMRISPSVFEILETTPEQLDDFVTEILQ